jgi:hypothetical protein
LNLHNIPKTLGVIKFDEVSQLVNKYVVDDKSRGFDDQSHPVSGPPKIIDFVTYSLIFCTFNFTTKEKGDYGVLP